MSIPVGLKKVRRKKMSELAEIKKCLLFEVKIDETVGRHSLGIAQSTFCGAHEKRMKKNPSRLIGVQRQIALSKLSSNSLPHSKE